ncbi:serine hydrolase domain-containing protein [Kitasatospora phosalacinea]|uniref:serine hydrolase domain-containing protein n=1 Tax=Kitasatospora phosalacinea TaxID=2065 RepID=UPI00365EB2C0
MTTTRFRSPLRRSGRTVLLAAAAAASLATVLPASPPAAHGAPPSDHSRRVLLQRWADELAGLGATGVQVRLSAADGRAVTATAGTADLTTRRPVPADGYFRVASVTKSFLATVVLQLAAEGQLSLDDRVERWLPGAVSGNGNDGREITLRQLLQHTAGLHDDYPDYTSEADFRQHRYDSQPPSGPSPGHCSTHRTSPRARAGATPTPGTCWGYSNTGYVLLGMVVERATGRPWYEEV